MIHLVGRITALDGDHPRCSISTGVVFSPLSDPNVVTCENCLARMAHDVERALGNSCEKCGAPVSEDMQDFGWMICLKCLHELQK